MSKPVDLSPKSKKTLSRTKKRPGAARISAKKGVQPVKDGDTSTLSRTATAIRSKLIFPFKKLRNLRQRRAHKSFRRTRRRDYIRPLALPGYLKFTGQVFRVLRHNKRVFVGLSIVSSLLALVLGGLSSHELYTTISQSIMTDSDEVPLALQVGTLVMSTAGLLTAGGGEAQQVYIAIIALMTWLTTVWLLREIKAGQRPRLRDGLYSSGSPIIATVIVAIMLLLQMIPIGLLAVVYSALSTAGMISEGLGALLFFGVAALIITLTLYWVTSTFFAMVIVTLPGMYPWRAMTAASDIIVGRRLRMLYRMIWMMLIMVILWAAVMAPVVMLNAWLVKTLDWFIMVPLVPIVSTWLMMMLTIWAATYVYLLYRKVVASDAESSS